MSNEILFFTQMASIVTFIVALFVVYRSLASQKDATIELQKERISLLEQQLWTARGASPDLLVEKYHERVQFLTAELERLSNDQDKDNALIEQKKQELERNERTLRDLKKQLHEAESVLSWFFCRYCGEPVAVEAWSTHPRDNASEGISAVKRSLIFRCDLHTLDGEEISPCQGPPRCRACGAGVQERDYVRTQVEVDGKTSYVERPALRYRCGARWEAGRVVAQCQAPPKQKLSQRWEAH